MAQQNRSAVLSERLQKLLADTSGPSPYPVTDDGAVVVTPLTRKRSQGIRASQVDVGVTNALLQQALNRSAPERPQYPVMPEPPEKGAATGVVDAYKKAVETWKTLVSQWETLHEQWEREVERNSEVLTELAERYKASQDRYWRELFGAAHDAVMAIFDELLEGEFDLFAVELQQHFGLVAKPSQVPEDGSCPECGHMEDEEQALKAPESSTSSKTIGTQSNATLVDEDSMLAIGCEV